MSTTTQQTPLTPTTGRRPRVTLAMESEGLARRLLDEDSLTRLRAVADISDRVFAPDRRSDLGTVLAETDILLTSWGAPTLDDELLAAAPRLSAVIHAAGTVKPVATPAAWRRGIRFSTAADANSIPVAEYALAMILLAGKRAFDAQTALRARPADVWATPETAGNYDGTVGIVGASRIGVRVMSLLRPFDVRVLLADPTIDAQAAAAHNAQLVTLDELLSRAGVVSLHAPLLPSTRGMITERELALMADGATLINTARGALVDTDALTAEVVSGRLRAVLDVFDPDPLPAGHPLLQAPGAQLTPHMAGSGGNELRRIGAHAVAEIERLVATGDLLEEVRETDLERVA